MGVDLREVTDTLLSGGPVIEMDTLTRDSGALGAGEETVHIRGDVMAGAVVRGAGHLVVEGSVIGRSDGLCRIDMDGEVVIFGNVRQAHIKARRICVGKGASRCGLTTDTDLQVGDDLVETIVAAGGMNNLRTQTQALKQKLARTEEERIYIQKQVKLDQKRVASLFDATRISFDFNIGEIIRRSGNRLEVDLAPFYRTVGDKSPEEMDRALLEFFAKAVVGLLTRANVGFIVAGPNNRKVFFTLVRKVHDLFFLTRKLDKQISGIETDRANFSNMLEALSRHRSKVTVGGSLQPEINLKFYITDTEDDELAVGGHSTELTLRSGVRREVVRVNDEGESLVGNLETGPLEGLNFSVDDGWVVWEPIETPV